MQICHRKSRMNKNKKIKYPIKNKKQGFLENLKSSLSVESAAPVVSETSSIRTRCVRIKRLSFINLELSAFNFLVIHFPYCLLRVLIVLECHETEALASSRKLIFQDSCFLDFAVSFEYLQKLVIVNVKR